MPDNHKLVGHFISAKRAMAHGSVYYALGALEVLLADTLTELEINHPKTYQARVEYINRLITMAKERCNRDTMEKTND